MSKWKVEIEIDVDFDAIFAEIPEGLFSSEDRGSDDDYEIQCIHDVLRDTYIHQLDRKINNMKRDEHEYLKHHDECSLEVAREINEKMKITKIQ